MSDKVEEAAAALRKCIEDDTCREPQYRIERKLDTLLATVSEALREAREEGRKEGFDQGARTADVAFCAAIGMRCGEESIVDFLDRVREQVRAETLATCVEVFRKRQRQAEACMGREKITHREAANILERGDNPGADALARRERSARDGEVRDV